MGPGLGGSSGDLGGYASASSVGLGGYTSGGTDAGSDGVGVGGGGGADGVQATYQLLVRRESARLTEAAAPKLHEYLARKDRRDMRRSGRAGGAGDEDDAGRPFSP